MLMRASLLWKTPPSFLAGLCMAGPMFRQSSREVVSLLWGAVLHLGRPLLLATAPSTLTDSK
jgi:hypothetical protein